MAYLPPVNLPDLSQQRDYAGQLHGMISNVGDAVLQNRRFKVGDDQWATEQERLNTAQALAQSNADRNYALELQKFEHDQVAGNEYYAAQPIYNPDTGEWGLAQPNKGGGAASQVVLPEGYQYRPTTQNIDLLSTVQPMSRGVPVGPALVKDVEGYNVAQETGAAGGKSKAALPGIKHNVERAVTGIDELVADPAILSVVGPIEGRLPAISWDGSKEEAQNKIDFVLGQVFQQAYDAIRGAGPIAIYESQAAAKAYSKVQNQSVSDKDYLINVQKFRDELLALATLAEQKAAAAGQGGTQQPPAQDGYSSPGGIQIRAK